MKTIREETFEDGSSVQVHEHEDGHVQQMWQVRTPDGRLELVEWWIDPDASPKTQAVREHAASIATLDDARAFTKQLGYWDENPWKKSA